jgi:hypothetical protein
MLMFRMQVALEQSLRPVSNLLQWPALLPEQVPESVGYVGSSTVSIFMTRQKNSWVSSGSGSLPSE